MSQLEVEAVRAGAVRLRWAADSLQAGGQRLDRAGASLAVAWHGAAADAALSYLFGLAAGFRALASAHEQAAAALLACAAGLERAQAVERRAAVVRELAQERLRTAEQTPAAARTMAQHLLLSHDGLLRPGSALSAEARALEDAAVSRAVTALHELAGSVRAAGREAGPPPLGLAGQAAGVALGAIGAVRDMASFLLLLTGVRGVYDLDGQQQQERDLAAGLGRLAAEPTQAVPLLLGTDLLAQGRYGEWAGGLLPGLATGAVGASAALGLGRATTTGGRVATTGEKLASAGMNVGSQTPAVQGLAPAAPGTGGPVLPQRAALMAGPSPSRIADLTDEQRRAVLTQAGRSPALPARWSPDRTVVAVMQAATRPLASVRDGAGVVHEARVDGVTVRVRLSEDGVVTGVELLEDAYAERGPAV